MNASSRPARLLARVCAIAGALAIAGLTACTPPPAPKPPPPPPQAKQAQSRYLPRQPLTAELPGFLRLANMQRGRVPVRVGVLLPFSNGSPATRALAKQMMNAAELAMFDSRNPDILLMAGDEGSTPQEAATAARTLLSEGAEVIVGPLFSSSVTAVAPIARDHGVPVVAFSSDRAAARDGVYLLSYQPETEVRRVLSYAAAQGHKNVSALIPRTAYGDHVLTAFKAEATADHLTVRAVLRFDAGAADLSEPAHAAAASGADAILIAQGGQQLLALATGLGTSHPQLLGTGLWADKAINREPVLTGGWFAAPSPRADADFEERYRDDFGSPPSQLAPLAYDAISLVSVLASGPPYHRFTQVALTDPNGFSGVSGVFRFKPDGSCERGLAILGVEPDGVQVVDPAPRSFQAQGS